MSRSERRSAAAAVRSAAAEKALASPAATERRDGPWLAVVIAALNEADSIGRVLRAIPATVCELPVGVIVVDDGSTDDTERVAGECGAVVARHERNLGQGDGLRTGFAVALALNAAVVVTMDADGQHDPAAIPDLVGPIVAGAADYVQGSRFLGAYDDAGSARHLGIKGFTFVLNLVARTRITDCTNGFRAVRGSGLARMRLVEDRFSASEIIIQASAQGLRMREVPVHIRHRDSGESKKPRGLGYALGYLAVICRSWARAAVRSRRPSPPAATGP